ncbi:aspartyl/asparaginyl beta-hydroxylase domain-containing protein [Filimonas effusa]|uniref:Aspartyl/asparaginyl beta-hydroxylase domain-containing protein n=1 Tax=Filimonas effusa TaxID=2508721 RepID=A0A4Q1D9A9_9BACT|nr:aspartyl/asparaginyl beta-hydroxylase domain-containing protein [Filimonas effusa]RXK85962.1 aspartyl/asparaginyl beta-hydroxylase domain-containing protein [Filimonas effusa]
MIRFACLPLSVDLPSIQHEVTQLTTEWMPHLNTKYYTGNWDIKSLRSPRGAEDNSVPDLMSAGDTYLDTPLMARCPAIQEFTGNLQCNIMSVRLMNLRSGAVIKPHRDYDLCFEKGEARIHVPVFTNDQVTFYCEEQLVPMREGECWYINANKTHQVANRGTSDRIHLVIDCVVNDWMKDLFGRAEKNEVPDILDVQETMALIAALKTHHTEMANTMAASLQAQLEAQATA